MSAVGVQVSLLYFDGCPNWRLADERLRQALARIGRPDTPIEYRTVTTTEQAEQLGFHGSPTVVINARDPFLDRNAHVGLSCRVYRSDEGLAGAPTVEQLVAALHAAAAEERAASGPTGSGQPAAQTAQHRADHRPGVPAVPEDQPPGRP